MVSWQSEKKEKKPRRVAASAQMRSRQTEQDAGLIQSFLGGGDFQGKYWWGFMSRDWLFSYSVEWGPAVRAVRVFCRWNLGGRSSWGRSLATRVAQGAFVHTSPSFYQVPYPPDNLHRYFSLPRILFTFLFLPTPLCLVQIHVASDVSS